MACWKAGGKTTFFALDGFPAAAERQEPRTIVVSPLQVEALDEAGRQSLRRENLRQAGDTEVREVGCALRQALVKVLNNAASDSAAGTTIRVGPCRSEMEAPPETDVEITDQGIRVSPQQLERVDTRFYRADTSGAVPGTGHGLSIVNNKVELNRGHAEIDSVLGEGTVVTIWLPLAGHKEPVWPLMLRTEAQDSRAQSPDKPVCGTGPDPRGRADCGAARKSTQSGLAPQAPLPYALYSEESPKERQSVSHG